MVQCVQNIVLAEASGIVPCWADSLQFIGDFKLIHLLHVLLIHQIADVVDDVGEHCVDISLVSSICLLFSPSLLSCLADALQGFKGEVHEPDRDVNVWLGHNGSELELGHCLGYSDDGQECTWCDVHVADFVLAFSLELSLFDVSCHDVLVQLSWDLRLVGLCLGNERPHDCLVDGFCV